MQNNSETIIVGAGIAGLYTAYLLKKRGSTSFIVLEKGDIGGRAGTNLFHGVPVAIGAGVGRKRKDKVLISLLNDLSVPYSEFKTNTQYSDSLDCDVRHIFMQIKRAYESLSTKPVGKTFREFAEPLLGKSVYAEFIQCAGYTDYEKEDIESTLYDYGFDDNYLNWTGLSIPWKKLVNKLVAYIGKDRIVSGTEVIKITKADANFILNTREGSSYNCSRLIVATTASTLKKLFPTFPVYKQICGQPFLRIYGKFDKDSAKKITEQINGHILVVPGELQKIIPMNPTKGVFMIAYSDNRRANALRRYTENTEENRRVLSHKLETAIGLPPNTLTMLDMVHFYWEEGTHYYLPLLPEYGTRSYFIRNAQNPFPNIYVVGEVVSRNQGWVEGALESVVKIEKFLC